METRRRLYEKWKELLVYEEGDQSYEFECGWGVTPGELYVPADEDWDAVVPGFLKGRRAEMLTYFKEHTNYVIVEQPARNSG